MKFLKVFILSLVLTNCTWEECKPGEEDTCYCGSQMFTMYCGMDEKWPECSCYDNNGDGIDDGSNEAVAIGFEEPQNVYEAFEYYTPQCMENYIDDCGDGEIRIPCLDICWRICPPGMEWNGEYCIGEPLVHVAYRIEEKCMEHNPEYRLITIQEIAGLFETCRLDTFDYNTTNYCSPVSSSPLLQLLYLDAKETGVGYWMGGGEACVDQFGLYNEQGCAWDMIVDGISLDTRFHYVYADAIWGSVVASGICVRDI